MPNINLLPWREELRKERQRNFLAMLVLAAIVAAGCVFLVSRYYDARIANQNERNAFLENEIAKLDRKIARIEELDETRQRLLNRKRVIEELQANRTLMVRLFDQLVRTVPPGIRLLDVAQSDEQITINGASQSNARVSTYLRNLEASPVLHDPQLRIIEAEEDNPDQTMPFRFRVEAIVAPPETMNNQSGAGTETAGEGE